VMNMQEMSQLATITIAASQLAHLSPRTRSSAPEATIVPVAPRLSALWATTALMKA